jgi:hypothetical protein
MRSNLYERDQALHVLFTLAPYFALLLACMLGVLLLCTLLLR